MSDLRTSIAAQGSAADDQELLVGRLLGFVHLLRGQEFRVGVREALDTLRVAAHGVLLDERRLRWRLRSLLCGNADEWQRFDALFDSYWRPGAAQRVTAFGPRGETGSREAADDHGHDGADAERWGTGEAGASAAGGVHGGASPRETQARSDFLALSQVLLMQEMERMVERLARNMRRRILRRQRIARRGRQVHLRRTIRHSLRYGGTPLELVYRRRRRELPRLVLLLDVSRSMSLYSYLFLRFARCVLSAFRDARAFVFHTRLIPVTEVLRERDVERVKEKLAVMSLGWSGGTRIGESVRHFNELYARKLVNSRSIVVVVSDGFDTGAPELLASQLRRIRRRACKIVWLNPLLGRSDYQPIAGGMAAALPFVDVFAPANSLESLAALESQLAHV